MNNQYAKSNYGSRSDMLTLVISSKLTWLDVVLGLKCSCVASVLLWCAGF